jgi:mannose-6-phosphate isomerase-like protein (cupin superfamily)
MIARSISLIVIAASLTSCAGAGKWVGAEGAPRDLDVLLRQNRIADGENIKAVRVMRNERVEQLLVQVRDREPLHYHADSELTVFMLRGRGVIRIGAEETAIRAGDVVHVPSGVVHAYINNGPEVGVAFVVMAPPPGPADRVLVGHDQVRPPRMSPQVAPRP